MCLSFGCDTAATSLALIKFLRSDHALIFAHSLIWLFVCVCSTLLHRFVCSPFLYIVCLVCVCVYFVLNELFSINCVRQMFSASHTHSFPVERVLDEQSAVGFPFSPFPMAPPPFFRAFFALFLSLRDLSTDSDGICYYDYYFCTLLECATLNLWNVLGTSHFD